MLQTQKSRESSRRNKWPSTTTMTKPEIHRRRRKTPEKEPNHHLPRRPRTHHRQAWLCESKKIPTVTGGALPLWRVDRGMPRALSTPEPELQSTTSTKHNWIRHLNPETMHQGTSPRDRRRRRSQRRPRSSCKGSRIHEQSRRELCRNDDISEAQKARVWTTPSSCRPNPTTPPQDP